jgi:glucose/arabinose dehydrogenase
MSIAKRFSAWGGMFSMCKARWSASIGSTLRGRRARSPLRGRARLCLESFEDRVVLAPAVLDPNLGLRTVVNGLITPTSMVFLGDNDFFVTEKATGKLDHIINGVNKPTKFDFGAGPIDNLPVNSNSERGLLGIDLSPNFTNDHNVFLYWTQSSTGAVSAVVGEVPVLGNRVDRFVWNAATSTLTFDRNIIQLRAFQNDGNNGNPNQMAGNHDGGVVKFGPDGKLYIVIGDNGRRGWTQNLVNGPNGPGQTDENNGLVRGGPAPDDAHLTGVVLRLNPDGSVPNDNPFVDISASFQAPLLAGPDTAGRQSLGSFFTAFLNQARNTFSVNVAWENLGGPTLAGGAFITLGGRDGPAILAVPDLQGGLTSGALRTKLTAANFIAEPAFGINTFADAVNAVLDGRATFNLYTRQFPSGAVSGQIGPLDPSITNNLHKVFAYGIRNSFGFDFDPVTGKLWLEENGDQSFDKISIVNPGANDGWVQSSAPLLNFDGTLNPVALAEFKEFELRLAPNGPQ